MIHESAPWKERLLRDADILERWAAKSSITARRSTLLETKVFMAAYAIRKVAEAGRLSNATVESQLWVERFPATGHTLNDPWGPDIERAFDLARPVREQISILALANLLIHSLVFAEELEESYAISAFYVTSDAGGSKGLYRVALTDFIMLMRRVGTDYPVNVIMVRRPKGGWIRWAGNGEPPRPARERIEAALRSAASDGGSGD